ncbi:MAG: glycosyltransferase family 2 protein [Lachnospiraceae bacterium]|nr:glycosyltransferase family 2 protein [Lachnospiraceae bacterium]
MDNRPAVDVIIPTYKPTERLPELILLLEKQTYPVNRIILMNTEEKYFNSLFYGREFIRKRNHVTVVHLSKLEFNHGRTRAEGVKLSDAPYFICMTDDAKPKDETLVERLLAPILAGQAEFSFARQLPTESSGAIEAFTRRFNYPKTSRIKSAADLEELGIKTYFFSNVCAAYTRALYDELGGFEKLAIFNEDMVFAAGAIKKGYRIAYAADAKVYHSHNYDGKTQFKRNFDLGVSQAEHPEIFAGISSTGEGKKLVKQTISYLKSKKKGHLVPKLIYLSGCKFLGYKLGLKYKHLPFGLIRKCTLNKEYWMQKNIRTASGNIDATKGYGISAEERK